MRPVPTLHFGPFSLDGTEDGLWRGSRRCKLKAKAEAVLRYLVEHPGRLVRKTDLLAAVWPDVHVSDWVLTTCIREIRHVLGDAATAPRYIATVHRQGYRFIAAVTVADAPPPLPAPEAPLQPPRAAPLAPAAPQSAPTSVAVAEEYRLVTILCGTVVDAPALAARLGPERWYRVLQTVVGLAQEVLRHYAGTLILATSDGFTAVFGAPVAQEDHARRAVVAALALRQRLHDAPALAPLVGADLALGMGLHSGLVVVGWLGQDPQRLATVVGAPLHVATRLQQQATPGTILLSAATYALVHAEVRTAPGGTLTPDGPSPPVPLYVLQELVGRHAGVAGRGPRAQRPFVGRTQELALLHARLAQAVGGQGQVIGMVGEPGMGKSRLLAEWRQRLPAHGVTYLEGRCLSYGSATPYLPVLDLLRAHCGITPADGADAITAKVYGGLQAVGLAPDAGAPLLLHLLGVGAATEQVAGVSPETLKAKTFETLRQLSLQSSQRYPLILVVEDLHWSDPTSEELFASLVERLPGAAILFLGTYRPGYRPPWMEKSYATQLTVPPLSARESVQVLRAVLQRETGPPPLAEAILARAQGNPFFLEELAQTLVEQGVVQGEPTRRPPLPRPALAALQLPPTVQAVLAARIDGLSREDKHLLQCAAVIGTDVPVPLLQALAELPEAALHQGLAHLQAAEFLYETRCFPDHAYTFKHALTQEVAYQSLLTSTRQRVHQQIAQVLEARFPALVETQPELVAQHYTVAGCTEQAVRYWQRAGQHASDRSANVEAISHVTTGIELLKSLPETPERTQQAVTLHIALGAALQMTKGPTAPEVEQAYTQARALCQQVGETPELVPVLFGLWRFYYGRPQLHTARELGDTLLRLAHHAHDPALAVIAHYALGLTWFTLGAFPAARPHLEQSIARYTPAQRCALVFRMGQDPGVVCRLNASMTLWLLGYPEQALARLHDALALAHELAHPFSLAYVRCMAAVVYQFRRHVPATYEQAEACVTLSTEQGFPLWAAQGTSLRGWALAMQGQGEAGLAQVRQGITAKLALGTAGFVPYFCTMLADVSAHLGHIEDGLQALAEAHALVEQHEERWWEAEISRLRGVLLLRQTATPPEEAETWLRRALDVARRQEAKSLELRAAMSLSRLWQHQGKCAAAYELLAPVYGWFTEGFDTADLQEAKTLLEALG